MISPSYRTIRPLLALVLAFLAGGRAATPAVAQEKRVAQTNGVDNSKMGAYRALAQHIYADFQKGDLAAAALMAKVLERLWDKAEDYGGDTALSKTNHGLFEQIDKAMDDFLSQITDAKGQPRNPAKVKAAFNAVDRNYASALSTAEYADLTRLLSRLFQHTLRATLPAPVPSSKSPRASPEQRTKGLRKRV